MAGNDAVVGECAPEKGAAPANMSAREAPVNSPNSQLLLGAIEDYAICMLDPAGRVLTWNTGAQLIKRYAEADILGRHFAVFYTAEDRNAGRPEKDLTLAEEERFEEEGWRVRRSGEWFWAHVIINPIRSCEGEVLGYASITRDLTGARAAEEARRQSEEQLRLLIQGVTDYAIYMLSPDGVVTNWNAGAERIKGYVSEEIVGRHFSQFYLPEDQEAGLPALALRTAAAEGRFEREGWRVRKDGSRFWAHVIIDPIRSETGEIIGFAKVTRDITERMEAQKALEDARDALFQSQKLEAIGQLTGGIAHDFNNLLTAVLGSLELVRKRLPYDPKITPLIDNAFQGAERGASLTRRMLAFARKQDLRLEPVELCGLVRGMMDFLRRTIGGHVQIANRLPAALPLVCTDPTQVESALLNLIVNARDAMPSGGLITLSARTFEAPVGHPRLAPGRYVHMSVKDEGVGMDEATLAKATDPFFTTKEVGKGTGLGMPMVHGLMVQSGGDLTLASAPGEGTTVSLWFPIAPAAGPSGRAEDATDDPVVPGAAKVILVVDDDDLVLTNTAAMLEDLGYETVSAGSGSEALATLKQRDDIDLVLTDFAMPRMNGAELERRIGDAGLEVPVLITSGHLDLQDGAFSRQHLPKPFTQAQLSRAIEAKWPAEVRARAITKLK